MNRENTPQPPQVPEVYESDDQTIQSAHDNSMAPQPVPRPRRRTRSPEARSGPVHARRMTAAHIAALHLAGGDRRRVVDNEDGSYTVVNNPVER